MKLKGILIREPVPSDSVAIASTDAEGLTTSLATFRNHLFLALKDLRTE
jgi:hypothetical protein